MTPAYCRESINGLCGTYRVPCLASLQSHLVYKWVIAKVASTRYSVGRLLYEVLPHRRLVPEGGVGLNAHVLQLAQTAFEFDRTLQELLISARASQQKSKPLAPGSNGIETVP